MAAFTDIDVTACFDNQIRNLISLMTRRLGADRNISRCQTETLEKMTHRVRIHQGVSAECIKHSNRSLLYGSGQGSGAGVVNWHGHNEALISMYDETQPGCLMQSPDRSISTEQKVISFVDDNKLAQSFPWETTHSQAMQACTESINYWRIMLEISGGALAPPKCNIQFLTFDFNTYSYNSHYPYRSIPILQTVENQQGQCRLYDSSISGFRNVDKTEPHRGRKLLGVRLAADGNCLDEFLARKEQSQKMATRLETSNATPEDAYMIYVFRYCPAVFYCIPLTHFTPEQCKAIQSPFMNALLPKLRINRHIKQAVVWGPKKFGGLALANLETEQLAKTTDTLVGHVRASTPTGLTFLITCGAYQLYLGTQKPFFITQPTLYPHRPSSRHSKITFLWESLNKHDGFIVFKDMWTPTDTLTTCIMDAIVQAQQHNKGKASHIRDESVRLANTCRIWLRALHVGDLLTSDGSFNEDFLEGNRRCETELIFPNQPRPPEWVWKVWRQVLLQACGRRENGKLLYAQQAMPLQWVPPVMQLPPTIDTMPTLKQIVENLPYPYQQILGDIEYPADDGKAAADAIREKNAAMYSDGTVHKGCGAHAYKIRTPCDDPLLAITGEAPTCGDPDTISSLQTEHFGALAGIIWIWILTKKYSIQDGACEGAIDNLTVVTRLNEGIDSNAGHKQHLSTDMDVWTETEAVLSRMPIKCHLHHVKGHQDDMHKKDIKGPLTRDAFWNVQMDKRAERARLTAPTESSHAFGSSKATFYYQQQPIHTKIRQKIRSAVLDKPLQDYIQQKEEWDDETFDAVDWRAFEVCMNKMTIHKRINVAKYVFNWQNTGRQKQHFEEAQAITEDRCAENVAQCPMGCGMYEHSQHYLQCQILHDAQLLTRDFWTVSKWMEKTHTCPELKIVLERSLLHWMTTDSHIEIWELEDTPYREELERAIQAQNFIGWLNMLKGRIAKNWGDIQMSYYEEYYDELPKHVSASWWAGELIRQLLFFSLAAWQHRNNYLHNTLEKEQII